MPKTPKRQSSKTAKKAGKAKNDAKVSGAGTSARLPLLTQLIAEHLASVRHPATAEPRKPLPAGTVGTEIPIDPQTLQRLIAAIGAQDQTGQQLWSHNGSELLVTTGKVTVALDDGFLIVSIPVSCEQAVNAIIQVPFALGGKDSPSGLLMATEKRPRGPDAIIDVWSEPLIAFAWQLVMTVAMKVAAQSGTDVDGAGLIPISLTASKDRLAVLPIARHAFDRVQS